MLLLRNISTIYKYESFIHCLQVVFHRVMNINIYEVLNLLRRYISYAPRNAGLANEINACAGYYAYQFNNFVNMSWCAQQLLWCKPV